VSIEAKPRVAVTEEGAAEKECSIYLEGSLRGQRRGKEDVVQAQVPLQLHRDCIPFTIVCKNTYEIYIYIKDLSYHN
jgi:hypothetical protein